MQRNSVLKVTLILAALLFSLAAVKVEAGSILKNISYTQKADRLDVAVEISGDFGFETFELIGPKRLVLDLSPVEEIQAPPVINVDAIGVIRIRCGRFKPEVARIVFDLAEKTPSHKITRTPGGIQILFWQEEEIKTEVIVPEVKEEISRPEKKPAEKPVPVPVTQPVVSRTSGGFGRLQAGFSLFPSSLLSANKDLLLYGETGSLTENYKASFNLELGLSLGKFIPMKQGRAKIGADFLLWSLSHKGSFEANLPHPFLPSTPRSLPFEEKLHNSLFQVTAFILFPLVEKDKISFLCGPAIGYAFGQFTSLEDFSIEDNPPYSSADIILSSTTLIKETISDFIFEGRAELNYGLSPRVSFFALASLSYFNPKVTNLGKRAKFFQFPFCLGLEFRL